MSTLEVVQGMERENLTSDILSEKSARPGFEPTTFGSRGSGSNLSTMEAGKFSGISLIMIIILSTILLLSTISNFKDQFNLHNDLSREHILKTRLSASCPIDKES